MYRAGDWVTITAGELQGQTLEIAAVRMFATDRGYYFRGVDGLIPSDRVSLARERIGGNPCGTECDGRRHELIGTCDHCRGKCHCYLRRNA